MAGADASTGQGRRLWRVGRKREYEKEDGVARENTGEGGDVDTREEL